MRRSRRSFLGLLRAAAASLAAVAALAADGRGPAASAAEELAFPVSPLTIETSRGRFQFMVEMAETPSTWKQGLQNRQSMAPDAGMLFNYHQPREATMWMKDTLISLDMLFIDERGTVINIAERTQPMSLDVISSAGPVLATLEVNAGTAARLGIRPGDRVLHAIFAPR